MGTWRIRLDAERPADLGPDDAALLERIRASLARQFTDAAVGVTQVYANFYAHAQGSDGGASLEVSFRAASASAALVGLARRLGVAPPEGGLGYLAALHVLRAAQRDPRGLGYYIGPGTESFDRLCAVVAEQTGEEGSLVRARFGELTEEQRTAPAAPCTRVAFSVPLDELRVRAAIADLREEVVDNDALQHFDADYDDEDVRALIDALDGASVEGA
ncbi:MAG: hypothetical protein U0324_43985 [Polyangiales bacterium]